MSLYTNSVQRNRYHLYLWSVHGLIDPVIASGRTTYDGRKSGYLYKQSEYQGCVVGLQSFQSTPFPAAVFDNMYYGGTPAAAPAAAIGQGATVHVVLEQCGQSNGVGNLFAPHPNPSAYNTPNILASIPWEGFTGNTGCPAADSGILSYHNQGDPVASGIFIPSPLDQFTLTLRFNDWTILDLTNASVDEAGNAINGSYYTSLVVQPILKTYEVPVKESLPMVVVPNA